MKIEIKQATVVPVGFPVLSYDSQRQVGQDE